MNDVRTLLERGYADADPPPDGFERMLRRRDRKRRNQRIAAGVVGIAVFVAAVWIVTTGGSFNRTQQPADPADADPTGWNRPRDRLPDRPQHRRDDSTPQEHRRRTSGTRSHRTARWWRTLSYGDPPNLHRQPGRHGCPAGDA